MASLNSSTTVK